MKRLALAAALSLSATQVVSQNALIYGPEPVIVPSPYVDLEEPAVPVVVYVIAGIAGLLLITSAN